MLTYADRLKAMRDTKIRHTLEKRKQNGYTDLDDFGTVPFQRGIVLNRGTTAPTAASTAMTAWQKSFAE